MSIYHRNGNLVFTSKDINYGWNGHYKGKLCEQGAYVYIVKFINLNGEQFVQKGTVNLIR
jgi:gliding motility-associated-like protein